MIHEPGNRRPLSQAQELHLSLLVFAASLLGAAFVIIQNNSIRTAPFFVFLFFFGTGIMLGLGLVRGALVSLLIISGWILAKERLGVWEQVTLLNNLLELIVISLTLLFAGLYHRRLHAFLKTYHSFEDQLKQLDLEDRRIGLLRSSVGLLRLKEEEERAVRYHRPFALILAMARPIQGVNWEPNEQPELMRSIATSIKDTTRETDIPFLVSDNQIGIILPETDTTGATRVVNNIFNRMLETRVITYSANSIPLYTRAQLRFGFAVFLGVSDTSINMLPAAEQSLRRSLEINTDNLFQNIFMEWVAIGESSISTPLLNQVDD